MTDVRWLDQPEDLKGVDVLFDNFIAKCGRSVEIRQGINDGPAFVTAGNLFGSQTFECVGLRTAVKFANTICRLEDEEMLESLPIGVTAMNFPEDPED